MQVSVDDEGKTRVRHVYTVSAPIAGKVLRISRPPGAHDVSIHVGAQVTAEATGTQGPPGHAPSSWWANLYGLLVEPTA